MLIEMPLADLFVGIGECAHACVCLYLLHSSLDLAV